MSIQFAELAAQVKSDGHVSSEEILSLRQLGWGDGKIYREEAEAIFTINNAIENPSNEWVDFFVEAVGDFVLNGSEPKRMCNDEEAQWLIAQIDHDGQIDSMAELEAIVRIIEVAENAPHALKDYALNVVAQEVETGVGPTRCGGELAECHISAAECALIRRIIFASGGDGPAAVSRNEANMLFRLKDVSLGHENAPEWKELFVDGCANYLQGFFHANAQLDHARASELESFMNDASVNLGRFASAMAREIPNVHNHFGKVFGKKQAGGNGFRERMVEGEAVTEAEAEWLDEMIQADGMVDELERALLDRVKGGTGA